MHACGIEARPLGRDLLLPWTRRHHPFQRGRRVVPLPLGRLCRERGHAHTSTTTTRRTTTTNARRGAARRAGEAGVYVFASVAGVVSCPGRHSPLPSRPKNPPHARVHAPPATFVVSIPCTHMPLRGGGKEAEHDFRANTDVAWPISFSKPSVSTHTNPYPTHTPHTHTTYSLSHHHYHHHQPPSQNACRSPPQPSQPPL